MKKPLQLFKLLIAFVLLLNNKTEAQCTASFAYSTGVNGFVFFYSTSTFTTINSSYFWNYGNSQTGNNFAGGTTYTANGTYTVSFMIFDPGPPTCSSTAIQTIQITNVTTSTCNINPSFSHTLNTNGQVSFASTSTGTLGSSTFTWNYGDNTIGNGQTSSHTYTSNGNYPVWLRISNGPGCFDSTLQYVNVNNLPCNMVAGFNFTLGANGLVTLSSTSTGTSLNQTFYSWKKNHQPSVFAGGPNTSGVLQNGTYSITLVVSNTTVTPICIDSITHVINVTSNTCNIIPSFTYTQGSNGLFNFISTSTGTSAFTTYHWDFGDGFNITSGSNQSHTYTNAGFHQVYLTLQESNNLACKDSIGLMINVTTVPCVANSNFTLTQLSPGNWQATPQYPYNLSSAIWHWGDNTSTFGLYPSHTYSPTGMYTICLTVSVTCGGTSTTCAAYNITRLSSPMSMAFVNVVPPQSISLGISTINKTNDANVLIYPNPTAGEFAILINNLKDNHAFIEVYTMTGKLVHVSYSDIFNGQLNHEIKLKEEAEGVYLVKIKLDQNVITKKVILQK